MLRRRCRSRYRDRGVADKALDAVHTEFRARGPVHVVELRVLVGRMMAREPEVDALHAILGETINNFHPVLGRVRHAHAVDAQEIGAAGSHLG